MKYFLFALLLFFWRVPQLAAQNNSDSLERKIEALVADTVKVNRLNDLAERLKETDPITARRLTQSAIDISQKIGYSFGLSAAFVFKSALFINELKLDSGKIFADRANVLLKDKKDIQSLDQLGVLTNNYGRIFQLQQRYDSATEKYLKAVSILTASGNEKKTFTSYYNLSVIYTFLDDSLKMTTYAKAAYNVAQKSADTSLLLTGVELIANTYDKKRKFDSVLIVARQGLALAYRQNNMPSIGKFHQYIGIQYTKNGTRYDSAIFHLTKALEFLTAANIQYDIVVNLHYIGRTYVMMKDFKKAISYFNKAIELEKSLKLANLYVYSLIALADAEEQSGNAKDGYRHLMEYVSVSDSLQKLSNRKQVDELEVKYQTQKKETLLLAQEVSIQRKNILNYILAAGALLVIIVSLFSYRTYRQKQKIQQQRISELETEKQLTATEAVLKGEEQERTRLAKDLHDGLGGMLSGIKYSMNSMKENLIMTADNTQAFERSMDMLDSSIREMRRVAHNMMPEALVKFGLDTALKDFCNDINQSGALKVNYQGIGLEHASIDQTTAITIYRIVQELINNTLKHAAAETAIVQVTKTDQQLTVTVEDDGKGFDTAVVTRPNGIGWSNIRSRVDFLKGKLDVQSDAGKGTSVMIEFAI
jgi:two-component system NarL family sensor kinase